MSKNATSTFYLHQGNTLPIYNESLVDTHGNAVNLTTATAVKFSLANGVSGTVVDGAAGTIVSASLGKVSYTWSPGDTNTAGLFMVNWTVTWTGGAVTSYPLYGFTYLDIVSKLA